MNGIHVIINISLNILIISYPCFHVFVKMFTVYLKLFISILNTLTVFSYDFVVIGP